MREVAAPYAMGLAVLFLVSCASPRPSSPPIIGGADSLAVAADSLLSVADDLFIEKHAALLGELAEREREPKLDPRTIEARSLVTTSEEMYLRGETLLALELLDEAHIILRRGN